MTIQTSSKRSIVSRDVRAELVDAFAQKHGLCYASLLRWGSRQGKGANVPVVPDTEADPRFVPMKIEGEVLSGEYVLSWAGGRSLKIPRQFETDSLRRLLTVLEGLR